MFRKRKFEALFLGKLAIFFDENVSELFPKRRFAM